MERALYQRAVGVTVVAAMSKYTQSGLPSFLSCVVCWGAHMPLLNIGDPTGCLC
jgi:hypothetical protein